MLDRIRSFLAVLEEGSANRAAERLGVTQPTLSRHIQSLEQEIGGALFERESRGMKPTDLGFFLRDTFSPVLRDYAAACAEVLAFAQGRHSQLRVGYLGLAAAKFLNPALATLKVEFPDLRLLLFDLDPMEQLAGLREGRIDVAMVGQEVAALGGDFYQRCARKLGVAAVLPAGHHLAGQDSISLSALSGECFIGVSENVVPGRNRWMTGLCSRAGFKPRFIAKTENVSETFTRVVSEQAVTLLPDYLPGNPPPGVAIIPVADRWARWNLCLLRQRGRGSPASRRLIELIGRP